MKLSFEGLLPKDTIYSYYASNYNGYLGFNFADLGLITKAGIQYAHLTDTGFGSVLHGDAEAYTLAPIVNPGLYYGYIYSSYASESFNLRSGIFASYKGVQITNFETWNAHGYKARIAIPVGDKATTIYFTNYGNAFRDITRLEIFAGGQYATTTVMDNLRVHWNGPIPGSGAMRHHVHVSHPVLAAMGGHSAPGHSDFGPSGANGQHNAGYHGELASFDVSSHHGGGLTSEFSLPQAEHFGT